MAESGGKPITCSGKLAKSDGNDLMRSGHAFSANEQKVGEVKILKMKD